MNANIESNNGNGHEDEPDREAEREAERKAEGEGQGEDKGQNNGGPLVPDDFPRDPFPAALSGAQVKFSARKIEGRYVVGLTDDERKARFLMCSDLVEQLICYVQRKQRERPDLTRAALLNQVDIGIRRKGWDLGGSEYDWIMVRLRAKLLGRSADAQHGGVNHG